MINVHGLRRNVKNVVKNYSEAQIKVREATSNDPWGPSGTLMSEIADLTYNVVAFSEIMQVIWKRLNDHGKNWKHVYKALVLLEYLIKTGSEKVTQQCKENIFAIQTLKDFQYTEENKDQGINVREKAKQLVSLLKDDERLKSERARALKARERFAQATSHVGNEAVGRFESAELDDSHNSVDEALSPRGYASSELENARPQTAGEEELQLQLALAMSKEEAEQEERVRRNDDLRLKMALTESEEAFKRCRVPEEEKEKKSPAIDDLLGISISQPINSQTPVLTSAVDPWGLPISTSQVPSTTDTAFNWNMTTSLPGKNSTHEMGPWTSSSVYPDPWSSKPNDKSEEFTRSKISEYDAVRGPIRNSPDLSRTDSSSPFDMLNMKKSLSADSSLQSSSQDKKITPEVFLGPNSNLVNLDALINSGASSVSTTANSFTPASYNPFQAMKPAPPTINELRAQNEFSVFPAASNLPIFENASSLATNENSASNQSIPSNNNPFI